MTFSIGPTPRVNGSEALQRLGTIDNRQIPTVPLGRDCKHVLLLSAFLCAILFSSVAMNAQLTTADVVGTVTDSTGAVLPNAKMTLTNERTGETRTAIGLRNSHDKSMRLAMTCGYRVFVCSNMAFAGDFTPVLAKHSKSFSLIDCIAVGVDRMQRNFEPMRKQVEAWQRSELTDVTAKVVIYEAFVEAKLEAPKHLARTVHDLYFEPKYEEFKPRTIWSLSNAFTSAFKALEPIPQFKATAKLGEFLEARFSQSF